MKDERLRVLAQRIETGETPDAGLASDVVEALRPVTSTLPAGLDAALHSTDLALRAVAALLPGWAVSMSGTASEHGLPWVCTVSRTAGSDEDMMGVARAAALPRAILAAALRAAADRGEG